MRLFLLALALLIAAPAVAQVGTLEPVDEAADDPSFVLFRARLLEAVATRDTAHVVNQLAPNVFLSFGGFAGIDDFREYWLGDDDNTQELWTELARVLPFGSTYQESTSEADSVAAFVTVPYWSGAWPDSLAEGVFEHLAIIGKNVNVRAAPSVDASVLTQLSYVIVPSQWAGDNRSWVPVTLKSGEEGYVAQRFARSPIGYRMGFEKVDGRWRITFFVAGD